MSGSNNYDPLAKKIVALLAHAPQGLSFTEIVRLTGKPKETVNKRLKKLLEYGLIEKHREGRKTIYKLSRSNFGFIRELMMRNIVVDLFFLDHIKAFKDLLAEGHIDESIAALCKLSYVFPNFFVGYVVGLVEPLEEKAREMLESEEAPSFNEVKERLTNIASCEALYGGHHTVVDVLTTLPVAVAVAVVDMIRKGYRLDVSDEHVLGICKDDNKREVLWNKALELVRESKYGKRLAEVYGKWYAQSPEDAFKVVYEVYKRGAEAWLASLIDRGKEGRKN